MEGVGWVLVGCPRRAKPSRQSTVGRGRSKAADGPQPRADSHPSGRRFNKRSPCPARRGTAGQKLTAQRRVLYSAQQWAGVI